MGLNNKPTFRPCQLPTPNAQTGFRRWRAPQLYRRGYTRRRPAGFFVVWRRADRGSLGVVDYRLGPASPYKEGQDRINCRNQASSTQALEPNSANTQEKFRPTLSKSPHALQTRTVPLRDESPAPSSGPTSHPHSITSLVTTQHIIPDCFHRKTTKSRAKFVFLSRWHFASDYE